MLSDVMECATLLRDIRFWNAVFLVKKVMSFLLLLIGFFFFIFFSTGKKNIWVIDFIIYERITVKARTARTHIFIDHLFCQSVLLTFSVKNWVR